MVSKKTTTYKEYELKVREGDVLISEEEKKVLLTNNYANGELI